jgi:multicomponent Na+:H+ antiporter subunit F
VSGFEVCALVLLVAGVGPAVVLAARGDEHTRLVGLSLTGSVAAVLFLLLAQVADRSYELIVPLVMVPMSFAGVLVFTRLLSGKGTG